MNQSITIEVIMNGQFNAFSFRENHDKQTEQKWLILMLLSLPDLQELIFQKMYLHDGNEMVYLCLS